MVGKGSTSPGDVEAYLKDPKTCALYLSDALETRQIGEVIDALRDIRRANGGKVQSLNGGNIMQLAEVMEILEDAGIHLVAEPNPAAA